MVGIHYSVIASDLSAIAEATAEAKQSAKRREVAEGNRGDLDGIATLVRASLAKTTIAAPSHCEADRPTCSERFDRPERLTVEGLACGERSRTVEVSNLSNLKASQPKSRVGAS
jgi:hypothetical protein